MDEERGANSDSSSAELPTGENLPTGVITNLNNCQVHFPFEPYQVQKEYMSKVISTLNQGSVAALESPTGTGKTLSLLCSILAWVEENKMKNRLMDRSDNRDDSPDWPGKGYFKKVVFYASRTHTQLSKAMAELRKTHYRHLKATILGSREQMCVHPDLPVEESLSIKNAFCQAHLNAKTCRFYNRVEAMKADRSFFLAKDIEDLVVKSKKSGCCPFYMSRHLQEEADIVFLPYNYIFDRGIRRKLNLNFNGAIVILDEAHNIDRVCEDAASVSLSSTDIAVAIRDITEDMQRIHDEFSDPDGEIIERAYSSEDLMFMKERLMALEQEFDQLMNNTKEKSEGLRPEVLQNILNNAVITEEMYGRFETGLNAVHDVVEGQSAVNNRTRQQACTLRKVAEFISAPYQLKIFSPENLNSFVVHMELEYPVTKRNHFGQPIFTPHSSQTKPKGVCLNVWCLNPSLGMQGLWNTHSVILTSGTLSPLKNVILELGLKRFPACVNNGAEVASAEYGHVVPTDQFLIFSVGKGPNGVQLQYNFQNKENLDYWEELGITILNFIRLIPDGVLVFFPSYQALNKASNCWKFKGLWDRLSAIKPLFAEETDKRRFNNAIEGYRASVGEGKGGVLMGICRGKMSEGIDFSDEFGRAVIVCGLPYPPFYDPRIKSKMKYIDSLRIPDLKGQDWYRGEASRAVNQAIGRVIRHANDVGVILLCDSKFEMGSVTSAISAWLRPVANMSNFGMAISSLRKFFRRHTTLYVKKEVTPSPSKTPDYPAAVDIKPGPPIPYHKASSSAGCSIPLRVPEKNSKTCLDSLADSVTDNDDVPRKLPLNSPVKNWRELIPPPKEIIVSEPAKKKTVPRPAFIPMEFRIEPNTPEMREKAKRMNEAKFILHELKRTLEDESYEIFTRILRIYQQKKDLEKFINQLTVFFPKEDTLYADLFRECHKFLSGEARTRFVQHCSSNGYGTVLTVGAKLEEPPEF